MTYRSQECLVHDFGPVGGSDDEDILFGADTVHFSQQLIDDSVSCTTSISTMTSSSGNSDGVQLVEEEYTRRSRSSFVEDVSDVGLTLTEPHSKQFRALD